MQTTYQNEEYFICEAVEDMTVKLLNYRKAILASNFSIFKDQLYEISKIVGDHFGSDSQEFYNFSQPKLFCGSCGTPFTQMVFLILLSPKDKISHKIENCPKCSSQKITALFKL